MRLTLRTLLAYLDDILEPADAAEISRKIEESKFASDLVHRIRNSTRRLRLGAPRVEGRGIGLDANTVAEYLDNTLQPDQLAEFEKVCLESDVHLAEVASCHQILTLVLGEPAGVDESLRTKVYGLAGESSTASPVLAQPATVLAEEASPALLAAGAAFESEPAIPPAPRPKPDYMKVGRGLPLRSLAITLVCGFVLAVVALRAMGPFGPSHPLLRFFSNSDSPTPDSSAVAQVDPDSAPASGKVTPEPNEPAPPEPKIEPSPAPDATAAEPSTKPPGTPKEEGPPAEPPANPDATMPPPAAADAAPSVPTSPEPATTAPAIVGMPSVDAGKPATALTVPPPASRPSVGRYISEEQVLARFDTESAAWFRLAADQPLSQGDRLLSLPTYRPQILMSPNVKIAFSGETSAVVLEASDVQTPTLQLDYGRAVVISVDSSAARLRLELPVRGGVATLQDTETVLAAESISAVPQGEDPVAAARRHSVRLFVTTGRVTWQEPTGEQTVSAGQVLLLNDKAPAQSVTVDSVPTWVDNPDATAIEVTSSQELKRYLALDRQIGLSLLERAEFRREEVRALACRCLCSLDSFEPSIKAFDDPTQRSYWQVHFDAIRFACSRNSESATRLSAELQKIYGAEAAMLYRMFWGFSQEQLDGGAAKALVAQLEHPVMMVRVLAITNLRHITDSSYQYRPEQPPAQEKSKILRWRKALEEGEIRYKSLSPPPAPTRGTAAATGPASPAP